MYQRVTSAGLDSREDELRRSICPCRTVFQLKLSLPLNLKSPPSRFPFAGERRRLSFVKVYFGETTLCILKPSPPASNGEEFSCWPIPTSWLGCMLNLGLEICPHFLTLERVVACGHVKHSPHQADGPESSRATSPWLPINTMSFQLVCPLLIWMSVGWLGSWHRLPLPQPSFSSLLQATALDLQLYAAKGKIVYFFLLFPKLDYTVNFVSAEP